MGERRDFLKIAALLPLAASDSIASAAGAGALPDDPTPQAGGNQVNLPKGPPVVEQQFPNYQLLGSPDVDGNLFGQERPHDWQSTKDGLMRAFTGVVQESDPIHKWLRAFRLAFDDRAVAIILDSAKSLQKAPGSTELRYEPQLYDAWLRSAAALLDRCLQYRNQMGAFEMSGVNAGIGYLAFLKSKPLQRNLIIQSSGADMAEIEEVTQAAASERYRDARGLDKLFDKYRLQGLRIETEGGAAEAGRAKEKDRLRTHLLEKQFHIQIDAQLAAFTKLLSSGSSSNFAERYLRMHALLVEDLADAYRKLYSASKGIQQMLGISKVTLGDGSAINVDIPKFAAAAQLKTWVQQMIPPQEGDQRKPDTLDALVIWTRAVMRELDTRGQYEAEFTVSIPLNQPWGAKNAIILPQAAIQVAFNPAKGAPAATGTVTFPLGPDVLPFPAASTPKNIRMLGVGLSVEHNNDDASPPQYSASYTSTPYQSHDPDPSDTQKANVRAFEAIKMARLNAYVTTPQQTISGVGSYMRPAVYLSNVRIQGGSGGDYEPTLSFDPGCRNLSPFGSWTISIDPNTLEFFQSAAQFSDNWIAGLILHMRLRGSAV